MVYAWLVPEHTLVVPEGEMLPLPPAEDVMA
jgi:hypothetical protein